MRVGGMGEDGKPREMLLRRGRTQVPETEFTSIQLGKIWFADMCKMPINENSMPT